MGSTGVEKFVYDICFGRVFTHMILGEVNLRSDWLEGVFITVRLLVTVPSRLT